MDRPPPFSDTIRRAQGPTRPPAPEAPVCLRPGLSDSRLATRFPNSEREIHQAETRTSQRVSRVRPQRELENEALARKALDSSHREVGSGGISRASPLGKREGGSPGEAPGDRPRSPGPAQAEPFGNRLRNGEGKGLRLHGHRLEPPGGGARRAFDHPLWIDRLRAHRRIGRLAGAPAIRSSVLALSGKDLPLQLGGQSLPGENRSGKGLRGTAAPDRPRNRPQAGPSLTGIRLGPKAFFKGSKRPAIAPPHCLHLPSPVTR